MVKKANGKWRMCTNYTDLNKACPKIFFHYPDKLNAGATYQWMMDKVFAKMIGKEVEVYIDDMIVKTKD